MQKLLPAVIVTLAASAAFAGHLPGTGVINSKHDMNTVAGISADNQGRVCAFCHTPHHAVDLADYDNPLWSHTPTAMGMVTPYASSTFDAAEYGAIDPLIGPSRLCMSCHDGVIAIDQHYGELFPGTTPSGRFANNSFGDIAIGLGGNFANSHPIGFNVYDCAVDEGIFEDCFVDRTFLYGGTPGTRTISRGLYDPSGGRIAGGPLYFTCATCHDVHNKDNVVNDGAGQADGYHVDSQHENYFVYAPQSGSQLCRSCHRK